jgi:hypothetical protein
MKKIIWIIVFTLFSSIIYSQTAMFSFLQPPTGDVDVFSMNFALWPNGIKVVGTYTSQLQFGTSSIVNNNDKSVFVAHYDSSGISNYAVNLFKCSGSINYNKVGLVIDSFGNYYIGMYFSDSIILNNSKIHAKGVSDIIICKFNQNDSLLWHKIIGDTDIDGISKDALFLDKNNNLFINGVITGSINIDTFQINTNSKDAIILKFDELGNLLYFKNSGSLGWDNAKSLDIDVDKNIFLLGVFENLNSLYFDSIQIQATAIYGSTSIDCIAKYNENGEIQWVRHYGGTAYSARPNTNIIKCDSKGNVYVSGSFNLDFQEYLKIQGGGQLSGFGKDVFVMKYDKDGNFKWIRRTIGTDEEEWRGFTISDNDEIYLANAIHSLCVIGTDSAYSNGGTDILITKFDTLGNVVWMQNIGGTGYDEVVNILAADSSLYLLGQSTSMPCDFIGTDHFTPSPGNLFLAKMNNYQKWPLSVSNTTAASEYIQLIPNPSQGQFSVTLPIIGATRLSISSLTGQELFVQTLNPSQNTHTIQTPSLASGIYFVQIYSESQRWVSKLLIE